MISLILFAVLVAAVIGVLELTHRRRPAEPRPEADLRHDRDHQRFRDDLRAAVRRRPAPSGRGPTDARSPQTARPAPERRSLPPAAAGPVCRIQPERRVPAKASSAA